MRQRWKPAIAATATVATALGLNGCGTKIDDATRIADHKAAVARVPAEVVNQCTANLNVPRFGVIGSQTWKFLEPLAPDDKLDCLFTGNVKPMSRIPVAYYSARIEQVSGWPGTPGARTLYWCRIGINPDTGKAVLVDHQPGLMVKDDANIFTKEGSVERAKKCGIPLERVKNLIEKGVDALLPPKPSTPPARP